MRPCARAPVRVRAPVPCAVRVIKGLVTGAGQAVPCARARSRAPCADGRCLVMPRYTQPEPEQAILLHELKLHLPQQPAPRIRHRVETNAPAALRL